MPREKLQLIREAELNNNCPECFNQDISLQFFQKHRYGNFFHRITPEVTHEIRCNKCNSVIYPVRWTEDIERSFNYYQKMVVPARAAIRFTTLFYVVMLLLIILVAAGVYLGLAQL